MKKETCALCARRTLYVSLIFNAILFSVLIVIYHFHYKRLEEIADMMQGAQDFQSLQHPTNYSDISVLDETVCIECEHLGTSVKAEETFYSNITYSDSGQRMCCLKDRSLAELIQKILQRQGGNAGIPDPDSESLSWWRKRPNSAHLYLKDWDRTRLHWTDSENTGSAFSNLKIQDRNKLLIEEKGLYFIYATTVFDFTEVDEVPQVYYNITSYWPKLPHFRSFLLMGKYGGSRFSSKRHTGYLSGMAELYPGHQIKVSVNDHRFIDATPYTSFFGLFKL
uniref:Tumor necrosis factor ligand superfamily member 10-like n=1 Tax=Crassostrea virginica TaxID=6565 RepID=A0A8B8E9C8_CRAVI|nr:tumor necrosis factor ligand superfamily member 10-like [Crassostrea virginica]XP_022336735.1 tumor necrosis factor ligand superfamily member 10-like [Crassostrea virginica]